MGVVFCCKTNIQTNKLTNIYSQAFVAIATSSVEIQTLIRGALRKKFWFSWDFVPTGSKFLRTPLSIMIKMIPIRYHHRNHNTRNHFDNWMNKLNTFLGFCEELKIWIFLENAVILPPRISGSSFRFHDIAVFLQFCYNSQTTKKRTKNTKNLVILLSVYLR